MTHNLSQEQLEILKQHLISDSSFVDGEDWKALIDSYESQAGEIVKDNDRIINAENTTKSHKIVMNKLKLDLRKQADEIAELKKQLQKTDDELGRHLKGEYNESR